MFSGLRKRSIQRALGVLSLTVALVTIAASSPTTLQATQDAAPAVAPAALSIPDDLSAESLETVDAELAKTLNPKLAIVFDAAQPADARKAAAAELTEAGGKIDGSTPAFERLKRQLLRRTALMQAALLAAEVGDLTTSADNGTEKLTEAAAAAETMLTAMTNGEGWVTYLHLADLKAASADETLKKQVLENLSPSDTLNNEQLVFLNRPAFQKLKAALETSLAVSSVSSDEAAARAALNSDVNVLLGKECACGGRRARSNSVASIAQSVPGCFRDPSSRRERTLF
jgi:hypothetical protein